MAVVDVRFTALPAHVRTARLVALAVARRVGVSDDTLDEVRLAVSEACSRAVGVHAVRAPAAPVRLRLSDDDDSFTVVVSNVGPLEDDEIDVDTAADEKSLATASFAALGVAEDQHDDDGGMPSSFGLAVIGGLVDDVVVTTDDDGTHVTMVWPTAPVIPAQP
jgi:anti-sigma regulatory factor (Ser/Thr protein kinase)